MKAVKKNIPRVAIILVIWALAAASAYYVLTQERLQSPFATYYEVSANFSNLDAVVPNLGEPVNVAGVNVGQITGAQLHDGIGVLRMRIDPHKLRALHVDAQATLVPNTPLKDMQVDIVPGSPSAPVLAHGASIPLTATTTPIDADELLASLDADTRSYFVGLLNGLGAGLRGRGEDVRAALRALGPTTAQLRQITDLLAGRRHQLSSLVHNLAVLTRAAGSQDRQLGEVVSAGDVTLRALASQDVALRASISRLPGVLRTTQDTLVTTTAFAQTLGPTLTALTPTAARLKSTLQDLPTLFNGAGILPLHQTRQFVDALQPLARYVAPTVKDLTTATPYLTESFQVLNYLVNELAYNPGGADQGGLFWSAWFLHNVNSVVSTGDANGAVLRGQALFSCSSLAAPGGLGTLLKTVLGLSSACPP
ncbi:MAG: MlaD family protein [Solirubrobacteraceae bacterium]|nr:MAG: hypothetical protein DLM63_07455 [Solirubrobacterales bacterium]